MQAKDYRPDIDVLRAIAVLGVVFYHANIPFFDGGYVGVSIFFVISGYLITGIIKRKLESNSFSFLEFYENRIRRILPALLFMILVISLLVVVTSVDKAEVRQIQSSVKRILIAIPNIFFYLNTNYFDPAAETMHLLHTWSLGVEEQFYFIMPALLFFLFKMLKGKLQIIHILWGLCILSFISSLILIQYSQKFTFYMLPTRAWELLMGSILAYTNWTPKSQKGKLFCILLGLTLMLACICFYGKINFPALWALPPCLGASLFIAGGTQYIYIYRKSFLTSLLYNKFLIFIGLISYSLYLWHWPIFVFYSTFPTHKVITPFIGFLLSLLAIIIATFSWRFIEKPIRQNPRFKNRKLLWPTTIILLGIFLIYAEHVNRPFSPDTDFIGTKTQVNQLGQKKADNEYDFILVGDSHSAAISNALAPLALKYHVYGETRHGRLKNVYKEGTTKPELKGYYYDWDNLTHVLKTNKINTLILVYRVNLYLYGADIVRRQSQIRNLTYINNPNLPRDEALYLSFKDSIEEAYHYGIKNIIIQIPVPEALSHVPTSAGKLSSFFGYSEDEINLHLGESVENYNKRLAECLSVFERLKKEFPNVIFVDVKPYLLDKKQQVYKVINGKQALYYDDDHLSKEGALYVKEAYDKVFQKLFTQPHDK